MGWVFDNVGRLIARLQKPANHCEPFAANDSTALRDTLRPGDVLLVEGKGRISGSIKYLTQSTWSHSALYVGPMAGAETVGEPHVLIEANIDEGVVSAPLSKYLHCQTRICRPVGLSEADCEKVCRYASERIGLGYDFKNVIDLMRYLFPWSVTARWRRRPIDPTLPGRWNADWQRWRSIDGSREQRQSFYSVPIYCRRRGPG